MDILQKLRDRARAHVQHIVLPEGADPRTLEAAAKIAREGFARVTVLGHGLAPIPGVALLDPAASDKLGAYARLYFERRRAKGVTEEEARKTAARPLYFADLMVASGDADGSVGGALNTTAETVRAALHCIGLGKDRDDPDRLRYDKTVRSSGWRLRADKEALRTFLNAMGLDLIVEIAITRRNKGYDYSRYGEEEAKESPFDRVILLRRDGTIEAAEGRLGTWTAPRA